MTKITAVFFILSSPILCNCAQDPDSSQGPTVHVVSFGLNPDHPPLRSIKEGFDFSGMTGLIVHVDDRIDVLPKSLIRHERAVPAPISSRTSETVCTKPVQICALSVPITEQRCHQKCKLCEDCNLFGCSPGVCCSDVCENVTVGSRCLIPMTRCDAQAVHWKDRTVYADLGNAFTKEDAEPMKSLEMILQGVRLKLEPANRVDGPEGTECALGQFKPAIEGGKLSFTLGNVVGCPGLFPTSELGAGMVLGLIDRMSVAVPYSVGTLIKTQDGQILEKPKAEVLDVAIDFVGSVSIASPTTSQPGN